MLDESTKEELQRKIEKLNEKMFKLSTFLEENESISEELWKLIDKLLLDVSVSINDLEEEINYS